MVAEAAFKAPTLYEAHSFRSRESVGARVALARKALAEELGRELEPLGLSVQQALVIVLLGDERVSTAAAMCRELSHDAGAMTRLIDKLEALGLVRRVRREHDRRAANLELTKAGRALHARVTRVQVAVLNRMLRGLSRTQVRTLERLLERIVENAP